MEEELSMDNILSADEIEGLFEDQEIQDTQPEENEENTDENQENNNEETEETTEVTTENTSEKPEGVGSEDNIEEQEDTTSNKSGSSPKNNKPLHILLIHKGLNYNKDFNYLLCIQ